MHLISRPLLFVLLACGVCITELGVHAHDATLQRALTAHCFDCHNEDTTEGEFSLQALLEGTARPEDAATALERIYVRVGAGEMPPEDADTLGDGDRRDLIASVDARIRNLAEQLRDDPGVVAMPRLTPYEYRNVICELSGGIVTDGGRLLPNEGGAGEGFANVGAAQVMTLPQYEKYIDAAKDALRHLRVYPGSGRGHESRPSPPRPASTTRGFVASSTTSVWMPFPRSAVDAPAAARKEVVDEIIAWHVAQQQKWGAEHRDHLEQELGFVHAAYLEAALNYLQRNDHAAELHNFASIASRNSQSERINLAPAAMKKWWAILNSDDKSSPHAAWAAKWRRLAEEAELSPAERRARCVAIVAGDNNIVVETEDFAPPYEISFHEAKEEVLEAAEKKGHWPFRIEIGDAKELFLIVTDAGDGNRGEYAVWRRGRFVFRDGSSKPWQDAVTIIGARSGKEYPFGFDGEQSNVLSDDAVGAKPPGALKFAVPENAIVFEVDLTLDENRTKLASIQALVLKEKPKSSSYIPGRFVFGGKKRPVSAGAKLKQEQERALRKRNVSEANKTKIGLNAERNVFSTWSHTSLESIGGPWPDQDADKYEANFPYHYTVPEVLLNATDADLAQLRALQERLASLVSVDSDRRDPDAAAMYRREAESFIRPFARRAWRRNLTAEELHALMRLYDNSQQQGLSFDSSVKSSLLLVLSSPHFIYKQYPAAASKVPNGRSGTAALSSHALATRLAFFLWGSLPDDKLLERANHDELQDPAILRREAQRMLADPRARSLATDFAGQLWDFADFRNFTNPDESRFPEFTPELRAAMAGEVEAFLTDLFQHDRPLTNILGADYTFANELLAAHYEIDVGDEATSPPVDLNRPVPKGLVAPSPTFRRVHLPSQRGGLATMGLFLTKKSLPLRTSPVQRGVWVMENLLGRHLPNPPADVPPLSDDDTNQDGENIRQQLERHRAQASCASCHDKIDPLGISLENFDAIGRWRELERDGTALATVAETHDGAQLEGSVGLQAYLMTHRDEFVNHFNRKLLGYALGRSVHIGDRALLQRMSQRLEEEQFAFSVLIDEIVCSPQFRTKRSDVE